MSAQSYQLLLGPAGSGKSARLREAFVAAWRGGRAAQTLLLVPTASYREHTRNQVLRESGLPGFVPISVCTFRDLLRRLAPEGCGAELTAARRELLLRRLLQELPLRYLESVRDFPGFRETLAEAMEEVRSAGLEPQALESALGDSPSGHRHQAFLQILRAYLEALGQAGLDDRRLLAEAVARVQSGAVPVGLLLVDGFADFTGEQRQLLAALLRRASEAQLTLTLDPHRRDFFYQAERSRAWLKSAAAGATFVEVWLGGNRRARAESLAAVERGLREGHVENLPPLWQQEDALALFAAADRRDEAELMTREILRLARNGYRYREIGILVRRPADYAPLLRGIFRRLGIPLREFVPVSLVETAAGRHFRACLDLFVPGSRPESLLAWLKSPYGTVRRRSIVEKFEYQAARYLADLREGRWEACVKEGTRLAEVVERLRRFDSDLAEAQSPRALAAWAGRVWQAFTHRSEISDRVGPEGVLEQRAEAALFGRVETFLEEMVEAAEAEKLGVLTFSEFRELVLSLLAAETLAVRDRRQDAVNLMNPFEARQWELRVVFVAGLVEKEFPAPPRETLFLDDDDRRRIEGARGIWLPTTAHRALDERLLFYVAATRARERLYLTWPQADAAGTPLLRSFFLRELDPLLQSGACRKLERRRSEIGCPPALAAVPADLLATAHLELATRSPEPKALGRALALYERLRPGGATRRAALALEPRPESLGLEAVLEKLKQNAVRFSASGFQTFSSCAYKYFGQNLLKLKGPALPDEIDFLTEGKIAHETIEEWERGGRLEPIAQVLERRFRENTEGIPPGHRGAKSQAEMGDFLERFVRLEAERAGTYQTALEPGYVELRFGDGEAAPALRLQAAGSEVSVRGRVDRLEVAEAGGKKLGLVVDFKYSPRGFTQESLDQIRRGRGLQLMLYLLAVQELFALVPAGAELYPLKADQPGRSGIYDASLAGHIFRGKAPENALLLPPDEFRALLAESRQWLQRHAADIRSGYIAVLPEKPELCMRCDFYDLCRVKTWEVQQEQEKQEQERKLEAKSVR